MLSPQPSTPMICRVRVPDLGLRVCGFRFKCSRLSVQTSASMILDEGFAVTCASLLNGPCIINLNPEP